MADFVDLRRSHSYPLQIAYDPKLKRPGCVLLQAAHGCDGGLAHLFDTATWLTSPTPDLLALPISNEQMMTRLVEITRRAHEQS